MWKSRADRNAWLALAGAMLLGLFMLSQRIDGSPDGRVIVHDDKAPWIMAPEPFSAHIRQWGRADAPVTRFATVFRVDETEGAVMKVRAFGALVVRLNGYEVPLTGGEDRDWQAFQRIEVAEFLEPGRNRLTVEVRNRRGPGLLALRLVAGSQFIDTGARWKASVASRPFEPARIATDVQRHPEAGALPSPAEALATLWPGVIALIGLLGAASYWLGRRGLSVSPRVAAVGVALGWTVLFLVDFVHVPLGQGFDAARHLDYVDFLAEQGRVPLATDGWSMYHPPLYYLLVDALRSLLGWMGEGARDFATRIPSFAAGLALVWLSGRLAERLHPERPRLRTVAMVFTAVLPMNLFLAGYVSNEGLMAAFCAAALVAAVDLMQSDAPEREAWDISVLSVWIGLALLTKFTALVPAGVIGAFVGTRLVVRTREQTAQQVRVLAALILPALVISGWFYLRNVLYFGSPLVGNWNLPGTEQVWWSQPGFHTLDYYTQFGRVLVEPWFASFASFWDSLYSTAWGDGALGGKATVEARNPAWSYAWMALGYWAALPITALVAGGYGLCVLDALRDESRARRAASGLLLVVVAAMGFAIALVTMELPYFGQAKAFYGLCATPVLALCFARACVALGDSVSARFGPAAHAALVGSVGACLAVLFLGFLG